MTREAIGCLLLVCAVGCCSVRSIPILIILNLHESGGHVMDSADSHADARPPSRQDYQPDEDGY